MFIPFGMYKNSLTDVNILNIKLHNTTIEIRRTNRIKYLGIYIDSHLRWDEHINYVVNKIRKILYVFKSLDLKNLIVLYRALVESHLMYGIIGWGGVLNTHLRRLEITQKRILKIIFNKPVTYPTDELYHEARVYDIRQLYFCCISLKLFSEKKELISHNHQTRNKSTRNLPVVFMRTRTGQRCSIYLGPKLYNCIPLEIRT
ncbi:hypothetical protein NQ317_003853, partial [Molorchus minor]